MGDTEERNDDMIQRVHSSFGSSSSLISKQKQQPGSSYVPQMNTAQFRAQMRQFCPSLDFDSSCKSVGIPPSHPQVQPISPSVGNNQGSQNFTHGSLPTHSRSLSQPLFFSLDSLPPLSPSPYRDSPSAPTLDQVAHEVPMAERDGNSHSLLPPSAFGRGSSVRSGESLPPRKAHRRSNSDIPFGFSTILQSSPPLIPLKGPNSLDRSVSSRENVVSKPVLLIKQDSSCVKGGGEGNAGGSGERKPEAEVVDDLFSAYLNLDNIDALNSSGTDDKQGGDYREDDSRASGSKANGGDNSDNEATSSVNKSGNNVQRLGNSSVSDKREGIKRRAGGDIAPTTRHYRSVSMDSFMGKMSLAAESPKLPPPGEHIGQLSPSSSLDADTNALSLELVNGEFSEAELKKIMSDDKLAEIALSDPKRAKRILANRQSAARSKERKMRYITELEHKVQTLQTEATTLSAQVTLLQRDKGGLTSDNNELKFRLQAMEQQDQLRDALTEALTSEVQRLKIMSAEQSGDAVKFSWLSINHQMFQLHQNGSPTSKGLPNQ